MIGRMAAAFAADRVLASTVTGMGGKSGKLGKAFLLLGRAMGPIAAAAFAYTFRKDIERAFHDGDEWIANETQRLADKAREKLGQIVDLDYVGAGNPVGGSGPSLGGLPRRPRRPRAAAGSTGGGSAGPIANAGSTSMGRGFRAGASSAGGTSRTRARAAGGGKYSYRELVELWIRAGGDPKVAHIAAAVALAESAGDPNAKNIGNSDGSIDRGLWQINSVHGSLSTTNVMANARAAVRISSGGSNFQPWVAYNSGAYRQYVGSRSTGGGSGGRGVATRRERRAASRLQRMIAVADAIDRREYNYAWGGGHNESFAPTHGSGHGSGAGVGFDCSGAVSHVLHAADLLASPLTSGGFMRYGAAGHGVVTIYANTRHVWMTIAGRAFGTSSSNPGGGAGWFGGNSEEGYEIRHVPGMGGASGGMADALREAREARRDQRQARREHKREGRGSRRQHDQQLREQIRAHTPTARERYEQTLADIDVADIKAEQTATKDDDIVAIASRGIVLKGRLAKINRALKRKGLTVAQRRRLTDEKASIIGELASLGERYQEAIATPAADEAAEDPNTSILEAIQAAIEDGNRLREEIKQLEEVRIADLQRTLAVSQAQYPAYMAAIADATSGLIGGRIASSRSFPGAPGMVART